MLPARGGGGLVSPAPGRLDGVCFVVVQRRLAGGDLREVADAADGAGEVGRGDEVITASQEGETLARFEECLQGNSRIACRNIYM